MRTLIDTGKNARLEALTGFLVRVALLIPLLWGSAHLPAGAGAARGIPAPPSGVESRPGSPGDAVIETFDEERVLVRVTPVGAAQATDFYTSDLRILVHLSHGPLEASVTSAQADILRVRIDIDGEEEYTLKSLDGSETGIEVGERVELAAVPTDMPTASTP